MVKELAISYIGSETILFNVFEVHREGDSTGIVCYRMTEVERIQTTQPRLVKRELVERHPEIKRIVLDGSMSDERAEVCLS